jgi:hypothetical protein
MQLGREYLRSSLDSQQLHVHCIRWQWTVTGEQRITRHWVILVLICDTRKLHNEELNDLYSSPNIVRVIKSRRMRWAGHVAHMGWGEAFFLVFIDNMPHYKVIQRVLSFLILNHIIASKMVI